MEVKFFNCDYEDVLFSSDPLKIQSNKKNQSFEWLLWFLSDDVLYTHKDYDKEYLEFIKTYTKVEPRFSKDKSKLSYFWGQVEPIDLMRELNSKLYLFELTLKYDLNILPLKLKENTFKLETGELAFLPDSYSGRGHRRGPQEINDDKTYLVQKEVKRIKDFSTLIFKGREYFYQNIIDENFSYKGSLISKDYDLSFLPLEHREIYLKDLKILKSEYDRALHIQESYSIDSFTYKERNKIKIHTVSEINYRYTMGRVAVELKEKYFKEENFLFYGFLKSKPQERVGENYLHISPDNNLFHVVLVWGASIESINKVLDKLKAGFSLEDQ